MAESLQQTMQKTRETLGSAPGAPEFVTPTESADALTLYQQKRERESRTSGADYLGAMWRQDSPVDGVVAEIVGSQFAPDPSYMPFEQEEWKRLTEGISQEFHGHFYGATSRAHAQYIRQRLQQKSDDLQKLADLGTLGNAGRLAFNFVEPTSLLAGVASGGITKLASGLSAAARLSRAATTAGEAASAAAAVSKAAGGLSKGSAVAAGIAGGAAFEAGFEKLRQSVNFEDDSAAVVEAGLMGMIMASPFVALNAREMRRLHETAALESDLLNVAHKINTGGQLDANDLKLIGLHQDLTGRLGVDANLSTEGKAWLARFEQDMKGTRDPFEDADSTTQSGNTRTQTGDEADATPDRFGVNQDLHVVDEGGNPLHFTTQREAGKWMLTVGNKRGDQIWQIANHPSGRGFTVQQTGLRAKAKPKAQKGPSPEEARRMQEEAERRFEQEMAGREAKAKSELDELQASGRVTGDEVLQLLDLSQRRIRAKKAEVRFKKSRKAAAERGKAAEQGELDDLLKSIRDEIEAEEASRVEGREVFWRDEHGMDSGVVVGRTPSGKLKIDLFPGMPGTKAKTPSGSPRYKFMHRSDLDMDDPLWEDATPEGFGPNTAGGAQAGGTTIETSDISPEFDNQTSRAKWRLDLFARLNKSTNPAVQSLAHILIKDAIGNSKEWAQRWTASERKRAWVRVLGGRFHSEARKAFGEVRKLRKISLLQAENGTARDFYDSVSRVVRGDESVLAANPDIAPQLQRAASEMRNVYAAMAEIAKKSGLEGAEGLTPDAAYVNRIWNHDSMRKAEATHGADAVLEVLAGSISGAAVQRYKKSPRYKQMLDAGRGTDADIRRAKATSFLAAVKKLEFSPAMQDIHLLSHDMFALREALRREKLSDQQIDDIVDVMFEAKDTGGDAGKPTNLRFRFDLDETHSIKTGAGNLRLMDLMENDSRLLVDMYLNSMAGHAALADRGIPSRKAFQQQLEDARKWYADNEQGTKDAGAINDEIQMLEDIYSHITGRPMSMQHFNKTDRIAGALRAWARSAFLGQLGVAAAFEMTNAMALTGIRAFYNASGGFRGLIHALRTGKVPNKQLQADIERWTGFGQESAMAYARQSEVTDFTYDRGLGRFENWGNKASHVVDIISGNRHFTSMSRQLSTAAFIEKHVAMAGKKLSASQRERLVHQGVDDSKIDSMLSSLKQHTVRGPSGRVLELNWEDWKKADPKTFDTYLLVLNREVRDAIQEHDLGEVPMFMHTTIGKIFGELRTFMVAAHAKQFLKGLHYMDSTTMSLWMTSFVAQSMAYSAQTALNYGHNQAELDKRLTLERIASAAVQRMSVTGVMPALVETGWWTLSGGDSLFSGGSANTENRNILITPSGMMISRFLRGASVGAGAINPFTDEIVTRQDVKQGLGWMPGGNTWLMRNITDALSSNFPKQEAPEAP